MAPRRRRLKGGRRRRARGRGGVQGSPRLLRIEPRIAAKWFLDQFGMRAFFGDFAVVEHDDAVRIAI